MHRLGSVFARWSEKSVDSGVTGLVGLLDEAEKMSLPMEAIDEATDCLRRIAKSTGDVSTERKLDDNDGQVELPEN
jgi:hypothetical protein